MSLPEPGSEIPMQLYNRIVSLIILLAVVALQISFAMLLSQVWGVWAWVLLYLFGSVPAILALISVLGLLESVIMAVQSWHQHRKFNRVVRDYVPKQ
jgi:hypothetical protein